MCVGFILGREATLASEDLGMNWLNCVNLRNIPGATLEGEITLPTVDVSQRNEPAELNKSI